MRNTKFSLNVKNARTVGGASYITTSGAYVGKITAARIYDTPKGATMLALDFESNDGEKAHMQTCIYKDDGTETFARAILDSLMTVFRLRDLEAVQGKYRDRSGKEQTGYFFRELMNKPVGLLIQAAPEEYLQGGVIRNMVRLNLLTPFDANTRQNAAEILDNAEAKAVDAKLKNLKDKPLKKLPPEKAAEQFEQSPAPASYDDIPF